MGKSNYPFRSSVKFIDRLKAAQGGTLAANLTTLFTTDEALQPMGHADYVTGGYTTWAPYAVKLVPSGGCSLKIQPRRNNLASNTDADQRYSNHFFLIDKASLPGVTSINISSAEISNTGGTVNVDFDLILFPEDYKFEQDYQEDSNGSIVSYNKTVPSDAVSYSRNSANTESINISGLSSGTFYLLNLRAYSSTPMATPVVTTEYTYIIRDQSGGALCPANSF